MPTTPFAMDIIRHGGIGEGMASFSLVFYWTKAGHFLFLLQ